MEQRLRLWACETNVSVLWPGGIKVKVCYLLEPRSKLLSCGTKVKVHEFMERWSRLTLWTRQGQDVQFCGIKGRVCDLVKTARISDVLDSRSQFIDFWMQGQGVWHYGIKVRTRFFLSEACLGLWFCEPNVNCYHLYVTERHNMTYLRDINKKNSTCWSCFKYLFNWPS